MAHECIFCGGDCFCGGDIDDVRGMSNDKCKGCGCEEREDGEVNDFDDDNYMDDFEFIPCSECDGHPACEDFGCAYENGVGHLVKKDPGNDF